MSIDSMLSVLFIYLSDDDHTNEILKSIDSSVHRIVKSNGILFLFCVFVIYAIEMFETNPKISKCQIIHVYLHGFMAHAQYHSIDSVSYAESFMITLLQTVKVLFMYRYCFVYFTHSHTDKHIHMFTCDCMFECFHSISSQLVRNFSKTQINTKYFHIWMSSSLFIWWKLKWLMHTIYWRTFKCHCGIEGIQCNNQKWLFS